MNASAAKKRRQQREVNKFVNQLLSRLRNPESRIQQAVKIGRILAIAAGIGLVIAALALFGASLAIGLSNAMHRNWKFLVWIVVGFTSLPIAWLLFISTMNILPRYIHVWLTSLLSLRSRRLLNRVTSAIGIGFIVLIAVALAAYPIGIGYQDAREANPILTKRGTNDVAELASAVNSQKSSLSSLSATGHKLLNDLIETEQQIAYAKNQLSNTLVGLEQQRQLADKAAQGIRDLSDKQTQIQLRTEEFGRILDGHQPITRADLERTGKDGLILGAIMGFLTSIAAAYAYEWIRRKLRTYSSKTTTLPPEQLN